MMKNSGLLAGAFRPGVAVGAVAVLGAVLCMSVPAKQAVADDSMTTIIAKPVRNWQEPPIQDLTGQGGKVVRKLCAIESRFDNEILMAVLRNRNDEYALRMFVPTMMFSPGAVYPITLSAGDNSGSFDAVPIYPGTILVELGKDDALLRSFSNTGSLKATLSKSAFEFKSGDLDNGLDLLTACADTLGASVNSAGVAGPLPTAPGAVAPVVRAPSVANIDVPTRAVTLADLGDSEHVTAGGQGHMQEKMVLKPLKGEAEDAVTQAAETTTSTTAKQVKEEVAKSGFSLFSVFGDADEDEVAEGSTITAEKHYKPKPEPVVAAAVEAVAENTAPEDVMPEDVMAEETVAEETQGRDIQDVVKEVATQPTHAPAPKPVPAPVVNKADVAPPVEEAVTQHATAQIDDGRMIVFTEDEPKVEKESLIQDVQAAEKKTAEPAPQKMKIAEAEKPSADLEGRLEQLEQRLSAEVERNRQLEMQLRDIAATPVSGSASIDLNNPDQQAVTDDPAPTTTQDRVEAARQERVRIKSDTLKQRMETLSGLLRTAGVRTVASPAPEGDLGSDNNAFSWHTGQFYGGAEFGAKPRDVEFSSLVSAYLNATGQRCDGDFASHLDRIEARATGSIATAELVCVSGSANSAAAVVFYEDSNTFGVISHEGSSEELSSAIEIRDNIATAIDGKL